MLNNPLAPTAIQAAQQRLHLAHMDAVQAHGYDIFRVRQALWDKAHHHDSDLGKAILCLVAACGMVRIADHETGDAEHMAALTSWGTVIPSSSDGDGARNMLDCHDPLSPAKMAAAAEIFASAIIRAEAHTDSSPATSRRMVWQWAQHDPELRTAMLRLGTLENGPNIVMTMPDASASHLAMNDNLH